MLGIGTIAGHGRDVRTVIFDLRRDRIVRSRIGEGGDVPAAVATGEVVGIGPGPLVVVVFWPMK